MADSPIPDLTANDIAALLDILRKADRPMTTADLAAALRAAAARS